MSQVSELWAEARGEAAIEPDRIALALRHTFAVVAAFASEPAAEADSAPHQLVGLARCSQHVQIIAGDPAQKVPC